MRKVKPTSIYCHLRITMLLLGMITRLGIIYAYTHVDSGRMYIGKTIDPIRRRSQHEKLKGKCSYLNACINKYGINSFKYEVLMEEIPELELNAWEEYFIWYFQSRKYGLNITAGGDGVDAETIKAMHKDPIYRAKFMKGLLIATSKPEWRKKNIDRIMKTSSDPQWRKKISELAKASHADPEKKKRHIEAMKKLHDKKSWRSSVSESLKKKYLDGEYKTKRDDALRIAISRPIVCIETNKIYESLRMATLNTGTEGSTINRVCKGTRKTAGGYHWRYATPEEVAQFRAQAAAHAAEE